MSINSTITAKNIEMTTDMFGLS